MLVIRSRIDDGPIAEIYRHEDLLEGPAGRKDINAPDESLQVAIIRTPEAQAFKNHKHIPNHRAFYLTQESWYVVSGRVRVSLFDIDDAPLADRQPYVLDTGDMLVIHRGGHGYHCEPQTCVVEFKSGPFTGREADKVLL